METESAIQAEKRALRAEQRRKLGLLPPERRAEHSRSLLSCLRLHPQGAPLIAFVPLASEPDVLPLLRERWAAGTPVVLPRVAEDGLVLHRVSAEAELVPGAWGILEPPARAPRWDGGVADCLVPGLAFDAGGFRLGRGKAYYDRLLGQLGQDVCTTGVFFALQEVERVPREAHDRRLHAVVTERGFREF